MGRKRMVLSVLVGVMMFSDTALAKEWHPPSRIHSLVVERNRDGTVVSVRIDDAAERLPGCSSALWASFYLGDDASLAMLASLKTAVEKDKKIKIGYDRAEGEPVCNNGSTRRLKIVGIWLYN